MHGSGSEVYLEGLLKYMPMSSIPRFLGGSAGGDEDPLVEEFLFPAGLNEKCQALKASFHSSESES